MDSSLVIVKFWSSYTISKVLFLEQYLPNYSSLSLVFGPNNSVTEFFSNTSFCFASQSKKHYSPLLGWNWTKEKIFNFFHFFPSSCSSSYTSSDIRISDETKTLRKNEPKQRTQSDEAGIPLRPGSSKLRRTGEPFAVIKGEIVSV